MLKLRYYGFNEMKEILFELKDKTVEKDLPFIFKVVNEWSEDKGLELFQLVTPTNVVPTFVFKEVPKRLIY